MNYTGFFNYYFLTVPTTTLQLCGNKNVNGKWNWENETICFSPLILFAAEGAHGSMLLYNDDNNDNDFIYVFHRNFLKMLNTIDPPESHWVLKSPEHTLFPKTLLRHYCTTKPSIIMLHRDMKQVLPSYAYLCTAKTYFLYKNNQCQLANIGAQVLTMIDTMVTNMTKFRQENQYV